MSQRPVVATRKFDVSLSKYFLCEKKVKYLCVYMNMHMYIYIVHN